MTTQKKTRAAGLRIDNAKVKVKRLISNMDGPAALPRKNGELVFESPWESKTFGMALALHEKGLYDWDEFRKVLIDEIKEWEFRSTENGEKWSYYERWLSTLEDILVMKEIFSRKDLEQRTREFEEGVRDDHHRQDLRRPSQELLPLN